MRIFFLFILLQSLITSLSAQTLKGRVSDGENAIPFANITLKGLDIGIASDVDGFFIFNNIPKGKYELIISVIGYNKYKKEIEIVSEENICNSVLLKSSYDLDQVVVTGNMKESFIYSSPVKVEVLTQKFLNKISTSNVMEVVENINGLQKQVNCGVCGTNDIHINGMEGPYTLVLIDGMPIMSSLSTVYGLNGIPTSLIKQIEVIKGPSSTLYGSEAVAGVINIITKEHQDVSLLEFDAYFTSHEEKKLDFVYAPKINKSSVLFSGNVYDMQKFIDDNNDEFSDIPIAKRISLFNRWSFQRDNKKKLDFSAKYYYENRYGGMVGFSDFYRGSDSLYGESIYTDRFELTGTYQLPLLEDIRIDASYNYHHQDSYYGNSKYEAWQEVYFANFIWNKKVNFNHDFLIGYTHRYQTYIDNTLAMVDDRKLIPGFFIQDEINLRRNLILLAGLRLDHHKNHNLIYSPRLNFKWNIETYTNIRLNGGTGFRTVNLFTEDHAALSGSRDIVVEKDLNPEESYNISLNFNHVVSDEYFSGTIDFDIFYTYFTNKIIPDYNFDPNKIVYSNLNGISISRGFSFSVDQNFSFPLSINMGGTFLDVFSENLKGVREKELFVPDFSGVFSLSYFFKKKDVTIDFTGKIIGPMNLPIYPQPFSRSEVSPWFMLNNFQLKKIFNSNLSIYLGIKNIFNYTQNSPLIDWKNPFSDNFDTSYSYGPLQERSYVFGLKYQL